MSKVSKWKNMQSSADAIRPKPLVVKRRPTAGDTVQLASVDDQGDLRLEQTWVGPEAALELAEWILDHFGDRSA